MAGIKKKKKKKKKIQHLACIVMSNIKVFATQGGRLAGQTNMTHWHRSIWQSYGSKTNKTLFSFDYIFISSLITAHTCRTNSYTCMCLSESEWERERERETEREREREREREYTVQTVRFCHRSSNTITDWSQCFWKQLSYAQKVKDHYEKTGA